MIVYRKDKKKLAIIQLGISLVSLLCTGLIIASVQYNIGIFKTTKHPNTSKASSSSSTINVDFTSTTQSINSHAYGADEYGFEDNGTIATDSVMQQRLSNLNIQYMRISIVAPDQYDRTNYPSTADDPRAHNWNNGSWSNSRRLNIPLL